MTHVLERTFTAQEFINWLCTPETKKERQAKRLAKEGNQKERSTIPATPTIRNLRDLDGVSWKPDPTSPKETTLHLDEMGRVKFDHTVPETSSDRAYQRRKVV